MVYEPFFLMYGFQAATAVEIVLPTPIPIAGDEPVRESRDQALKRLAESQQQQKKAYDLRHKDVTYKVEDWVLIEDLTPIPGLTTKLRPLYKGPAKVVGVSLDGLNCTCEYQNVQGQQKQVTQHVSHLKKYEVRHPLKIVIKKTVDGFVVTPEVQQVVEEPGVQPQEIPQNVPGEWEPTLQVIRNWELR